MFENILTKENVTFKDFEEIAYKMYLLSNPWQNLWIKILPRFT